MGCGVGGLGVGGGEVGCGVGGGVGVVAGVPWTPRADFILPNLDFLCPPCRGLGGGGLGPLAGLMNHTRFFLEARYLLLGRFTGQPKGNRCWGSLLDKQNMMLKLFCPQGNSSGNFWRSGEVFFSPVISGLGDFGSRESEFSSPNSWAHFFEGATHRAPGFIF